VILSTLHAEKESAGVPVIRPTVWSQAIQYNSQTRETIRSPQQLLDSRRHYVDQMEPQLPRVFGLKLAFEQMASY